MDKNDMIHSRNEAANEVAEAFKAKADVLRERLEMRSNTADEELKLEEIQKDLDSHRSVLRAAYTPKQFR